MTESAAHAVEPRLPLSAPTVQPDPAAVSAPAAAGSPSRTSGRLIARGSVRADSPFGTPRRPPWWTTPVLTFQEAVWMLAFAATGIVQWRKLKARPEFPWAAYCELFGINYEPPGTQPPEEGP